MRFLDNVLQDYIDRHEPGMERAAYSAGRERSVGLGVMGFHSFLQARGLPSKGRWPSRGPEDLQAYQRAGESGVDDAGGRARALPRCGGYGRDGALLVQDGDRADRVHLDHLWRHQRLYRAIPANIYTHKTLSGQLLDQESLSGEAVQREVEEHRRGMEFVLEHGGSVQHLDFLSRRKRTATRPASRSISAGCSNWPVTAPPISTRRSR